MIIRTLIVGIALSLGWLGYSQWMLQRQATVAVVDLIEATDKLTGDATRGEYVASMSGCIACHTNTEHGGAHMAGGVPIATPFGTFYSPNITPDKSAGIGDWTQRELTTALVLGRAPDGSHYFPSFPYTSYSSLLPQDMADLHSWLSALTPVSTRAPAHDVLLPRLAAGVWKALFFKPVLSNEETERGRYLVQGPGHCQECHAPRNLLGGQDTTSLSGNKRGPDGHTVPGITRNDLVDWQVEDIELFLEVGITPEGDFTGGHMADVIEFGTAKLTAQDRQLIAAYLLSGENQ